MCTYWKELIKFFLKKEEKNYFDCICIDLFSLVSLHKFCNLSFFSLISATETKRKQIKS